MLYAAGFTVVGWLISDALYWRQRQRLAAPSEPTPDDGFVKPRPRRH